LPTTIFNASILGDLADRCLQSPAHDVDAGVLVVILAFGFKLPTDWAKQRKLLWFQGE
jgi:hypothetical protein